MLSAVIKGKVLGISQADKVEVSKTLVAMADPENSVQDATRMRKSVLFGSEKNQAKMEKKMEKAEKKKDKQVRREEKKREKAERKEEKKRDKPSGMLSIFRRKPPTSKDAKDAKDGKNGKDSQGGKDTGAEAASVDEANPLSH